jgi:hypothetical protein
LTDSTTRFPGEDSKIIVVVAHRILYSESFHYPIDASKWGYADPQQSL